MNVGDIPKIYTALAEWISCLIFVLVMKKRWGKWKTAGILYRGLADRFLDSGHGVCYVTDVRVYLVVL